MPSLGGAAKAAAILLSWSWPPSLPPLTSPRRCSCCAAAAAAAAAAAPAPASSALKCGPGEALLEVFFPPLPPSSLAAAFGAGDASSSSQNQAPPTSASPAASGEAEAAAPLPADHGDGDGDGGGSGGSAVGAGDDAGGLLPWLGDAGGFLPWLGSRVSVTVPGRDEVVASAGYRPSSPGGGIPSKYEACLPRRGEDGAGAVGVGCRPLRYGLELANFWPGTYRVVVDGRPADARAAAAATTAPAAAEEANRTRTAAVCLRTTAASPAPSREGGRDGCSGEEFPLVVAEASPIQDDAVRPVRFYPATLAFAEFEVGGGGCDGGPPSPPPHQCSNGEEEELVEIRVYAGAPPASTDWGRLWERGPADLATAAATPVTLRSRYGWRVEDGDTGEVVWECGGGGAVGGGSSNFGDPPPEAGEGEPCGGREYGVRVDRACLPKRGCRRFVFGQPDPAPTEGIWGSGRYNPRFEVRVSGRTVSIDDSATYRAVEWGGCSSSAIAAGAEGDCGTQGDNSSSSLLEIFRYQDRGFALSFALRDARTGELVAASDPGATARRNSSSSSSSSAGLQYERWCVRSSQCYTLTLDRDPRTTQAEAASAEDAVGNSKAADVRVLLDGVYLVNAKMHELDPVDGKRFEPFVVPLGNCTAESLCHDDSVGSSRDNSSSSSVVVVRWDNSLSSLHRPYYEGYWQWLTLEADDPNNPFNDGDGRVDRESYRRFGNGYPPGGAFLYQACVPDRGGSLVFGMSESALNFMVANLSWTIEKDGVPLECQYQFPPGDYSRSSFAHLLGYVVTPLDGSCPFGTAGGAPPATAGAGTAAGTATGGFSTLAAAAAAVMFTLLAGTRRIRRRRVDPGPSEEAGIGDEEGEAEQEENGSDDDGGDVVSGGDLASNGEPIDRSTAPLLRS